MSRFVLDASTALTWCFPDEHSADAQHALDLLQNGAEAISPTLWPLEILNALLVAEKRQRITQPKARAFLRDLEKLSVRLDAGITTAPFIPGVESLARQHGLTAYDAAYLELAQRLALPLATLDKKLVRAAGELGVPLVIGSGN